MNPKINKIIDEIARTKAKVAELQTLLPELERRRLDMENAEIVRLVRSADIAPADFPDFIASLKTSGAAVPAQPTETHDPARSDAPVEGGGYDAEASDEDVGYTETTEEDDTDA